MKLEVEELGYEEDEEEVEEIEYVKKQEADIIPNWIFLLIMASIYGIVVFLFYHYLV